MYCLHPDQIATLEKSEVGKSILNLRLLCKRKRLALNALGLAIVFCDFLAGFGIAYYLSREVRLALAVGLLFALLSLLLIGNLFADEGSSFLKEAKETIIAARNEQGNTQVGIILQAMLEN